MTRPEPERREEIRGPDGRLWGRVSGESYVTHRTGAMYCRKYQGWGLQLDLLKDLRRMGIREITMVVDGHALFSTLDDWERHAVIGTLNPAHGEQAFLPERYFRS